MLRVNSFKQAITHTMGRGRVICRVTGNRKKSYLPDLRNRNGSLREINLGGGLPGVEGGKRQQGQRQT
jgi:hypothetical protein